MSRGQLTSLGLLVVLAGSLLGLKLERAALGDIRSLMRHESWYAGVILGSNKSHRVFVTSELDEPFPVQDGERLVVGVLGWTTEEYLHRGHWLLGGLEIQHRMKAASPLSFSSDPADALAATWDTQARTRGAQLLAPLLVGFAHQPPVIRNGYTWTNLNERRLALRVAFIGLCAVSGGLLTVRLHRWVRRDLRASTGRCVECGYSMDGLAANSPCPECGHQP